MPGDAPSSLDPEARRELQEQDPELLEEIQDRDLRYWQRRYPKPTAATIQALLHDLESDWEAYHNLVNENRDLRYQRDETPKKWKRFLHWDGRVRTRLTQNEVMRVVANHTRNAPKFSKLPAGDTEKDRDDADAQSRWASAFIQDCERKSLKPLRRSVCDAQDADGLGIWEVYYTGAYDDIETDQREEESARDYNKRMDRAYRSAGSPIGIRPIDPIAYYDVEDPEAPTGLDKVIIYERKPYRPIYAQLERDLSSEEFHRLRLPRPGDPGAPYQQTGPDEMRNDYCETIRYYDNYWYAWVVQGELVECHYHGFPGVPVFPQKGMTTSSPNRSEQLQGITWGMGALEKTLNDLMTLAVDVAYTYTPPRWVVETDVEGSIALNKNGQPATLDLTDPSRVRQLNPGQRLMNASQGVSSEVSDVLIARVLQLWERNGLNPIAQGQSPGADPAGYTVNTLMGASQAPYEILLDNESSTWGRMMDFIFKTVRDVIAEPIYLPSAREGRYGKVEWLVLSPETIDDAPFIVTIDPLADANRIALRQSLTQAWKEGLIARRRVQVEGFGIDDTEAEDDEIMEDAVVEKLFQQLIELAQAELHFQAGGVMNPGQTAEGGIEGATMPAGQASGAVPASPQPPTVGTEAAAASNRPGTPQRALPTARALAGQGQGPRTPIPGGPGG